MSPTITAVIPTYNRADILREALESVFAQTRPADEIVVVDDGSTDHTASVAQAQAGRIRYVAQPNRGPAAARNRGMREAGGEYIAFLDSDDLWTADCLASFAESLRQDGDLDFIFALSQNFTAERTETRPDLNEPEVRRLLESSAGRLPDPFGLLLRENVVRTSAVLVRRRCALEAGLIDESLRHAEDYDFWLRLALRGCRVGFVNRVLCRRRLHSGNLINEWLRLRTAMIEVLGRYREISGQDRRRLEQRIESLRYDVGSYLLAHGDGAGALPYFRQVHATGVKRLVLAAKVAAAHCRSLATVPART